MNRGRQAAAVLLAAAIVAAGCLGLRSGDGAPSDRSFDGGAAYALAEGLALDADGQHRYRIPGTPGQAEGAAWLHGAMQVEGWSVQWQNFTGADYRALEKGSVEPYHARSEFCSPEDDVRLDGLPFHNLYAQYTAASPEDDRIVLLAAHWDSKKRASLDPDPERRGDPVPGGNNAASAVGVVLQFMRHVSAGDIQVPHRIGVVFFDGEDGFEECHPLAGSVHFAHHLEPGMADRLILLDLIGDPEARYIRETHSMRADSGLMGLLWEHGHALGGAEHFSDLRRTILDDHLPLIEIAGVPAVDLIDAGRHHGLGHPFPPHWRTTHDTLENVDPAMLGLVGDVLWATLEDPRFVATWPAAAGT